MYTVFFRFSELPKFTDFISRLENAPWFSVEWIYGSFQFKTNDNDLYIWILALKLIKSL